MDFRHFIKSNPPILISIAWMPCCGISCDRPRKTLSPVGINTWPSRAGRGCWFLPLTSSSADQIQPEACLHCLATLCLICMSNYAGEHKAPLLHHRKYEKYRKHENFFFSFRGSFEKRGLYVFCVFSSINDPRYKNLTTNISYNIRSSSKVPD